MRGPYPNYEEYATSITALTNDANQPPVADAEPAIRSGPAPLTARFDDFSYDPEGDALSRQWDFGDGTGASGATVSHTYTERGRYFPRLTVSDGASSSTLVEEIAVGVSAAPTVHTGGAAGTTAHGAVDPNNRDTRWYFEYGPTNRYGARTPEHPLPGDDSLHQVSTTLPGLVAGRLYHYRLVASNATGSSEGEDHVMVAGSAPGTDAYRDAVLATPGLAAYWRLGELSGSASREERGGDPGAFTGRFVLGQVGVLGQLGDTAASFDGVSGERVGPGPALGPNGTMEGWFRWRAGTAVMRDNTGPSRGWLLAFNSGGTLRYRVGGTGFDTTVPIEDVRDGTWHHLAATKDGGAARFYLDGEQIHSGVGAAADTPALPWHVMRNGTNAVFSEGEADEIALYDRPLTAGQVRTHYDLALALAARPLPPETPDPVADPPAAGTGLGGGVLGGGAGLPLPQPAGRAFVRDGRLVVRGAPGARNRLSARRRGGLWRIADAEAPLRAGTGCRRRGPRSVSCRAAGVRRIVMYGGAGADRLMLVGRTRAVLYGGPGADRLVGGPLTRFRGGPGADRFTRRR
jgi:PKD repeat protein